MSGPLLRVPPCIHLHSEKGLIPCETCTGNVKIKTFNCDVFGECTVEKQVGETAVCWKCEKLQPVTKESMIEKANWFIDRIPEYPADRFKGRGVVIAGGGKRYFGALYVSIRALRHNGCKLPIEVWYLGRDDEMPEEFEAMLTPLGVKCVDGDQVRKKHPARILNGWELKVFAILHSRFREVLFLDADCYAVQDPTPLFDHMPYRQKGAIFYCDMQDDHRMRYDAFGCDRLPNHGSIESGQLVINKETCWREINLCWHYNDYSDYWYHQGFGDKHTFEGAWARLETDWVQLGDGNARWEWPCFKHPDTGGRDLFLHRCRDKFRIEPASYLSKQEHEHNVFCGQLPMENECWSFLMECVRHLKTTRDYLTLNCDTHPIPGAVNHDQWSNRPWIDDRHDLNVFPWPWADNTFLRIDFFDGIEHSRDIFKTMAELHRVVQPGGLLEIRFPRWDTKFAHIDPGHILKLDPLSFEFFTLQGFGRNNRYGGPKWEILESGGVKEKNDPIWKIKMKPIK